MPRIEFFVYQKMINQLSDSKEKVVGGKKKGLNYVQQGLTPLQ
jgi:hypothetical protein